MTLKEKALEAWTQQKEDRSAYLEEQRKHNAVMTLRLAARILGEDVAVKVIDGDYFAIGDLQFHRASGDGDSWLELKGECPNCGLAAWSKYIYSLADLGQILEEFEPTWSHHCPELEPEILPDVDTRIAIALETIANHLTWEK